MGICPSPPLAVRPALAPAEKRARTAFANGCHRLALVWRYTHKKKAAGNECAGREVEDREGWRRGFFYADTDLDALICIKVAI